MSEHSEQHHLFGPSSLERRSLCPGSYSVERAIPDVLRTSDAAESGTRIHAAIQRYVEDGLQPALEDNDEQELAEKCCDFVAEYKRLYGIERMEAEIRLQYSEPMGPVFFGTCDVLGVDASGLVHIIDWKTGFLKVPDAKDNLQGMAYALAAMQSLGRNSAMVTFFNPRIGQKSSTFFDSQDEIAERISGIIARCMTMTDECIPGDDQCRYCRGAITGQCCAWRRWAGIATLVRDNLDVKMMPDEDLANLYRQYAHGQAMLDLVREEILARLLDKGNVGGIEAVETNGRRECSDIAGLHSLMSSFGMSPLDFLSSCSVSLSKMENAFTALVRAKSKGVRVSAIRQEFREATEPFVTRGTPRRVLKDGLSGSSGE